MQRRFSNGLFGVIIRMTKCIHGSFNPHHQYPELQFSICKDVHQLPHNCESFVGVIDTGFTGFIQLPTDSAHKLALSLSNKSASNELADGTRKILPLAEAVAIVNGKPIPGYVQVSPSPFVLLGMDFLRKTNRALIVSKSGIYLFDEDYASSKLPNPNVQQIARQESPH